MALFELEETDMVLQCPFRLIISGASGDLNEMNFDKYRACHIEPFFNPVFFLLV